MKSRKSNTVIIILCITAFTSCIFSHTGTYTGPHTLPSGEHGKNLEDTDKLGTDHDGITEGIIAGTVTSVNYKKNEIIVHQKKVVDLGSAVYVITDNRKIFMTVSFPMLSSFKCTVVPGQSQYVKNIKKGMTVYLKN